jgi:hypothetical protein
VNGDQERGRRGETDALQAEERSFRYLKVGGGLMLLGFVLMLTTVLVWLGAPLAAIGAAIIVWDIVSFLRLQKMQGINVTCPHCNKDYTVLPGMQHIMCDECKHVIPVPRAA